MFFATYIGTFVSTFTRFLSRTCRRFCLDKNGEQLISKHLDRTVAAITSSLQPGDRFVIAAHSLGSVVVHDYMVARVVCNRPRTWCRTRC